MRTVSRCRPNVRAVTRMLIPSTITARRTRRYTSTLYIRRTIRRIGYDPMNGGGRCSVQSPNVSNLPPARSTLTPPITRMAEAGNSSDRRIAVGRSQLVCGHAPIPAVLAWLNPRTGKETSGTVRGCLSLPTPTPTLAGDGDHSPGCRPHGGMGINERATNTNQRPSGNTAGRRQTHHQADVTPVSRAYDPPISSGVRHLASRHGNPGSTLPASPGWC